MTFSHTGLRTKAESNAAVTALGEALRMAIIAGGISAGFDGDRGPFIAATEQQILEAVRCRLECLPIEPEAALQIEAMIEGLIDLARQDLAAVDGL